MESVEDINQQRVTGLGMVKAKTEDEFLVKIGAKEEFEEWDPKVTEEHLRRSRSFMCPEYHQPACYRRKPKLVLTDAWTCNNQACRQLFMQQRFGPKSFYINNPKVYNIEKKYLNVNCPALSITQMIKRASESQYDYLDAFPKTQSLGICSYPGSVESL